MKALPNTAKLTDAIIRDAKPGPKKYLLWDEAETGLALKVMPSGHKSFVYQYRPKGLGRSTPVWITLKDITGGIAEARKTVREYKVTIDKGGHPRDDIRAKRAQEDEAKRLAVAQAAQDEQERIETVLGEYLASRAKAKRPVRYLPEIERAMRVEIVGTPEKPGLGVAA